MKSVKKIEKLVRNRRYKASAEAYDKALDSFMLAVDDHVKQKSASTEPKIWRTIMKSRILKIAAAAVIIIAGFAVIYQSGGSIDGATIALAQITENMKQMPWLHAVVERAGDGLEAWFCFERGIMVHKRLNGEIRYHDDLKQTVQVYDPDANTITVSYTPAVELAGMGRLALDSPEFILKLFEDAGEKVIQEKGKYKGKDAKIYKMSGFLGGMDMKIEMTVDAEKNILLFLNQKAFDKAGKLTEEGNCYFDYPETGPESIYDAGVPTSARIVSPEKEKNAYDEAFEKAIAEIDSRQNWPEPRDLVVRYWQARNAKNFDEMAIFWPGSATWNRQALEKEEAVEYVFGEVQAAETEGDVVVPYASKSYYDKHGKFSLKMVLSNRKNAKKRYYIVSGN